MTPVFAQVGLVAAVVLFVVLSFCIITVWRARYDGVALGFATLSTAAWCALLAAEYQSGMLLPLPTFSAEVITDIAWLNFIGSLFRGAVVSRGFLIVRYSGVAIATGVLTVGLLCALTSAFPDLTLIRILIAGSLLTSIAGLVAVEQVIRNSRAAQRRGLRYVCLAVGVLFFFDLVLYADAILQGQVNGALWDTRGFAVVIGGLLLTRALMLRKGSTLGVFVSRRVAFYTATVVIAGVFFVAIGLVAQVARSYDLHWSSAAEIVLFGTAAVALLVVILSDRYRNWLRVFVDKHFFESKYDYRHEWRRLNHTLTSPDLELPLAKRAIRSLLDILEVDAGVLWVFDEQGALTAASSWNCPVPEGSVDADNRLLRFMQSQRWVIDLKELLEGRADYKGVTPEDVPGEFRGQRLLVPLQHDDTVCGVIGMSDLEVGQQLNFEDYDLLKIVGQQVASYLEQERATARLTENMQFEAFSKLTAYLMHDLKNTMAQQQLIVENAEKHRRNPEFVDDAIETIRGSTARIRRVIEQLKQASRARRHERVDVTKLALVAITRTEHRQPAPTIAINVDRAVVLADEEQLTMAICHAISNAQDATPDNGAISVSVDIVDQQCHVRIEDNGAGMASEFVRGRLFKPFDSTKGAQGMGIGAHQIRETVRGIGGDVSVKSEVGKGTCFELRIPLAAPASS